MVQPARKGQPHAATRWATGGPRGSGVALPALCTKRSSLSDHEEVGCLLRRLHKCQHSSGHQLMPHIALCACG